MLYVAEFHPVTSSSNEDLAVTYDYFHSDAKEWDDPGTYADAPAAQTANNRSFEWTHGPSARWSAPSSTPG